MRHYLIRGGEIVNENKRFFADILIKGDRIANIGPNLSCEARHRVIDAAGSYVLPGVIDDQVHFREPGFTHKATIHSESRAAVAGGVSSFMEMPNTRPPTTDMPQWEKKNQIAKQHSLANYAFYMGATSSNIELLKSLDPRHLCGIKVFVGSSTGELLLDDEKALEEVLKQLPHLIAVHSEDERILRQNEQRYKERFGEQVPMHCHAEIRSREGCFLSTQKLVSMAKKYGTRLHILHLSTAEEIALFAPGSVANKRITAEACIHHLWFSDQDYASLKGLLKANPSVKTSQDRQALWQALAQDKIDLVASDHAPHTLEEKQQPYFSCPSGLPLVQHSLVAMLEKTREGLISIESVVEKMCHNPARLFNVAHRGFLREDYFADLAVVLPEAFEVSDENTHSQCGWSPFSGQRFHYRISHTFVSGHLAYSHGTFDESTQGQALVFARS